MSDATWLYAVAARGDLPADLRGVAGEPVRPLPCGQLIAVVGSVGLELFGEEPLRRALNDPVRMEHLARAHHEVVETVARGQAVVPFRLATIYLGDDRLRSFVADNRAALGSMLRRVDGHAEWGVKAFLEPVEPDAGAPRGRGGSGTAYLMRRREQLHRREKAWAEAVSRGDGIHRALTRVATDAVCRPVSGEEPQDGPGRLVLHAAYLVPNALVDRFAETARALSETGVHLQVTGPWAAYSFLGTDPVHDGDGPAADL